MDDAQDHIEVEATPSSAEATNNLASQERRTLFSPVQEHHIDFLLEEEFVCNPSFLTWFLENVQWHPHAAWNGPDTHKFMKPHDEWDCKAVRSVTTGDGETDVLVIYRSASTPGRTAILIENKIRASFQPGQPERYRKRGDEGKENGDWNLYWTCLIAPERYPQRDKDFNAGVSLEKLLAFFSGQEPRSLFKAGVIRRALHHFQQTGVQVKDGTMTNFRAHYAQQAEADLSGSGIRWQIARDAWWGDQWFRFTGGGIPAGGQIIYKSEAGFVDLAFPKTNVSELQQALMNSNSAGSIPKIVAKQTGSSASLRIQIAPISDFADLVAAEPIIGNSLRQARNLIKFYKENEILLGGIE